MGKVKVTNKSKFKKTLAYLDDSSRALKNINLDVYGRRGLDALREATPKDSGETADSWDYKVERNGNVIKIIWTNNNITGDQNIPVALLLQYGHATKNGAWVEGLDYINPALKPIFDDMSNKIWKEANKF